VGLADELLEDAHSLADKGITDQRQTLMRRSISTAYYAAFHLFIDDFVEHWEFPDQRARLGRMFGHGKMCTGFTPKDKRIPRLWSRHCKMSLQLSPSFRRIVKEPTMIAAGGWSIRT